MSLQLIPSVRSARTRPQDLYKLCQKSTTFRSSDTSVCLFLPSFTRFSPLHFGILPTMHIVHGRPYIYAYSSILYAYWHKSGGFYEYHTNLCLSQEYTCSVFPVISACYSCCACLANISKLHLFVTFCYF